MAARPFKQWADEWLAKKKLERVGARPKTIEELELRVGYVKDRFGKLCRQDIKRQDAFMRSYEAEGKLATRDRIRSIGEPIYNYADIEGDAYIPRPVAALFPPAANATPTRTVTDTSERVSSTGGAD